MSDASPRDLNFATAFVILQSSCWERFILCRAHVWLPGWAKKGEFQFVWRDVIVDSARIGCHLERCGKNRLKRFVEISWKFGSKNIVLAKC